MENIFDNIAKKTMTNWELAAFKKDFPTLYSAIIQSMGKAVEEKEETIKFLKKQVTRATEVQANTVTEYSKKLKEVEDQLEFDRSIE